MSCRGDSMSLYDTFAIYLYIYVWKSNSLKHQNLLVFPGSGFVLFIFLK